MSKTKEHNSGIYVIEIEGYEKFYIGSSINFKRRKEDHLRDLKYNRHDNQYLQRLYNKYGKDSFKFRLFIYTGTDKKYILKLEQIVIDSYNWDELINIARFTGTPKGYYPELRMFKEEDIKNIFKLAAEGKTANYISKIYKAEKPNIHAVISRSIYLDIEIDENILKLAQDNVSCNKNKKFTEEEIQTIKDNYLIIKTSELAKTLGRNKGAISNMARKLGLTDNSSIWTEEVDRFIIENYQLLGRPECAKRLNISKKALTSRINILKNKGIDIRINKVNNSTNTIWTNDKINFIKDNIDKGSLFLSKYFNTKRSVIRDVCCKYGIKLEKRIWSNDDVEFLMNNYKIIGAKECSKILNKSRDSIVLKYNFEIKKVNSNAP